MATRRVPSAVYSAVEEGFGMKLERFNENYYILQKGEEKIGIDLLALELWKDGGNGDKIHGKITGVTLLKIALKRNDPDGVTSAVADLEKLGFRFLHYT
jgi:hypothetical protein